MSCKESRRLFDAYWDDETTQGEREWLESHFASCTSCREEYEEFARALELISTLPRVEAAPDLLERAVSSARRAALAPDRLRSSARWVPVTAAAALLALVAAFVVPWYGALHLARGGRHAPAEVAVRQPELVQPVASATGRMVLGPGRANGAAASVRPQLAGIPDSAFDHSEDVDFVLDPVTIKRGRAHTVSRLPQGVQGEQAVITF